MDQRKVNPENDRELKLDRIKKAIREGRSLPNVSELRELAVRHDEQDVFRDRSGSTAEMRGNELWKLIEKLPPETA